MTCGGAPAFLAIEKPHYCLGMAKPEEDGDATVSTPSAKGHGGKEGPKARKKFFHCYLLQSQDPKHKRSTYIGFTVDPSRRIRQHK